MIELGAYICLCICGAGVIYGASAELIRELRFELIGKRRRRAIARLMEERSKDADK